MKEDAHILVVDDEDDMCWALANVLRAENYAVTTVARGKLALELMGIDAYEIVLVDAKLPDLEGFELATCIHQEYPDTVVILISGYYYQEDTEIEGYLRDGTIASFISKPFDIEQVRQVVRQVLKGRSG